MPHCECIVNKYCGDREIAQIFTPFGVIAVTDDGKVFDTLAAAIAHVKPKPAPVPEPAPEPTATESPVVPLTE